MNTDDWDDGLYPTPERRLMFEIGWLDLWHALRESTAPCTNEDGG